MPITRARPTMERERYTVDAENLLQHFKRLNVPQGATVHYWYEVDSENEVESLTPEQEQKKASLVKRFQETRESYLRGEGKPFTSKLMDSIIEKAKKRLITAQK